MSVPFWTWNQVSNLNSKTETFLDTEEVNKALDEIHQEMDKVVVTKTELNEAL